MLLILFEIWNCLLFGYAACCDIEMEMTLSKLPNHRFNWSFQNIMNSFPLFLTRFNLWVYDNNFFKWKKCNSAFPSDLMWRRIYRRIYIFCRHRFDSVTWPWRHHLRQIIFWPVLFSHSAFTSHFGRSNWAHVESLRLYFFSFFVSLFMFFFLFGATKLSVGFIYTFVWVVSSSVLFPKRTTVMMQFRKRNEA